MATQIVKCICDNSNWMSSLESATLKITSPTGKHIWLRKSRMIGLNEDDRNLVWKCVGDEMIRNTKFVVDLTRDEMISLLRISKL